VVSGPLKQPQIFYPQIPQIVVGGLWFVSRASAEVFSIRRLRRLAQILAACLVAARQFTPPVFYSPIGAD
jgi:hypothetical protein